MTLDQEKALLKSLERIATGVEAINYNLQILSREVRLELEYIGHALVRMQDEKEKPSGG